MLDFRFIWRKIIVGDVRTFNCGGRKMTWYYWVLTCWIGLNMLMISWFLVLGLLDSKRASAPSLVPAWLGGEKRVDEKRKFTRFKGKEGASAALIRPNNLMNVGQIQDISIGGLSFQYASTNEDNKGRSEIEIFSSNDRSIHLDKVQCRIVYDRKVAVASSEQITTRCCGVEFENPSVKYSSMLQEFIDHFAFHESRSFNPNGLITSQ
ncbi:MAG: PilZ domain-containing protein [Syntrophobacteraceae bacterium]